MEEENGGRHVSLEWVGTESVSPFSPNLTFMCSKTRGALRGGTAEP